jgi:hypothetical protein
VQSADDIQRVFPFVVGCPRSGTTLLRAMLDSHPSLAIPGESHFIPELWDRFGAKHWTKRRGRKLQKALLANERIRKWGLTQEDVAAAIEGTSLFPDAMRGLYAAYARSRGKARYGDKTPDYVDHIPVLAAIFPEARFVHLIRDGRDVALSLVDVDFGPKKLPQAALFWATKVRNGRRAGESLGDRRYRELRYEDLVREPETVLRDMCVFIELEFDPAMLRYPARSEEVVSAALAPEAHSRIAEPPTEGVRDWRRDLPPAEAAELSALVGDLLRELGYEVPVSPA